MPARRRPAADDQPPADDKQQDDEYSELTAPDGSKTTVPKAIVDALLHSGYTRAD